MRPLLLLSFSCLLLLTGCGGGGAAESATVPPPTGQTITVGQGTLTYQGSTKPTVTVAASAKTFSYVVTGGTFTNFNYERVHNSSLLPILVVSNGTMYLIQGGNTTQVSASTTGFAYNGMFTPNGQIIFNGFDSASQRAQPFVCYADGSGERRLTNSNQIDPTSRVRISPNGLHIVTDYPFFHTMTEFNGTGGAQTSITNQGSSPFWSPDSTRLCYQTSDDHIVQAPVGGAPIQVSSNAEYDAECPVWSGDGRAIAYLEAAEANSPYQIEVRSIDGQEIYGYTANTYTLPVITPSFSPDSKFLAFAESDGSSARLLFRSSWTGDNATQIGTLAPGTNINSISYAPFDKNKDLFGSTGIVSSATGFLLNQSVNNVFGSLVAVTASPASSTKITQINAGSNSAPIYQISGTSLTSLRYINGYNLPVQIVTLPASTTSTLVSVDPSTGQVTAVAPFIKRPANWNAASGASITLTADFLGVYDGKGKLVEPKGTRTLTIDSKTGALLKAR